jgi:hypothetical protein
VEPNPSEPLEEDPVLAEPEDPRLPLEPAVDPELRRLVELITEREVLALALPVPPVDAMVSPLPELPDELPVLLDWTVMVALPCACKVRLPPPPGAFEPRAPRNCGAMSDTNCSGPVTPLNRIVFSRAPDSTEAERTTNAPVAVLLTPRPASHHAPPAAAAINTSAHHQLRRRAGAGSFETILGGLAGDCC